MTQWEAVDRGWEDGREVEVESFVFLFFFFFFSESNI